MNEQHRNSLGAVRRTDGTTRFRVWAPNARSVDLRILGAMERLVPMEAEPRGYFAVTVDDAPPGTRYTFRLDGERDLPDPASRLQLEGVHGPSTVVDIDGLEQSAVSGPALSLSDYVIYALHVGTYTAEGTFDAVIPHLDSLRDLGVTAIELMPIGQFPGERNWGYDGVYPFAAQSSYGGPAGLQRLVNACHERGLAVILDVIYNHLGPEGNYLSAFGPYFTDRYRTPWGMAINFDGPESDEVRRFFIESALYWMTAFNVDAFRLDAVHAIVDTRATTFLAELNDCLQTAAERRGRQVYLIAETDDNNPRIIQPSAIGGYGHDAQWSDDFHHALHTLATGERGGYYQDFGSLDDLARAMTHGYVYTGQYSGFRGRRHGAVPHMTRPNQFVVCSQNHDQVGNRATGDRLSTLADFEMLKLAAAAVILSPYIPLLFMGEEYGEEAPFQYFTSHGDPELARAVTEGRRAEFASFAWTAEVPDPQDEATFKRSKLHHDLATTGGHRLLRAFYQELLRIRREEAAFADPSFDRLSATTLEDVHVLVVRRWNVTAEGLVVFHFAREAREVALPIPPGNWRPIIDSTDARWGGNGSNIPPTIESNGAARLSLGPQSIIVIARERGNA